MQLAWYASGITTLLLALVLSMASTLFAVC